MDIAWGPSGWGMRGTDEGTGWTGKGTEAAMSVLEGASPVSHGASTLQAPACPVSAACSE